MASLTASIRHKARSIADVVREHMSERSFLMFLAFIWIALVYIIVAFTDITAASFVHDQLLPNGELVRGPAIAGSSLLYLVLPILMGLVLRYTKMSLNAATLIFLPLVGLTIYLGPYLPINLAGWFDLSDQQAHKLWDVLLLAYCLVAGVVPMWALLQPRGHLGGYFLYVALAAGGIGLLFSGLPIQYPAFTGWHVTVAGKTQSLFPMLFITIACGACSGFHALIASGTTSKQLKLETDARPIGYGAMLLEGMVAVISLSCVMIAVQGSDTLGKGPNAVYAQGIGNFLQVIGIPIELAVSFALMAFTTFVYDTLDVCTRLGRYIIQELTGWHDAKGKWLGTALTAGVPIFFVMQETIGPDGQPLLGADGKPVPIWATFWPLFGASNQLLAALTLLGVTVWLWRTRRAGWVWAVTGVPTVWMYAMSTWALVAMTWPKFQGEGGSFQMPADPVAWAGVVLVALAAMMLVEAMRVIVGSGTPPRAQESLAAQPAG
jgi:carbon starvation protein